MNLIIIAMLTRAIRSVKRTNKKLKKNGGDLKTV